MEKKLDYGIDLMSVEHYDCAHENVWNFNGRGWKHEGHGIDLNLSNMLSGFNLTLFGKSFTTAEAAYICGFYSNEDVRCQEIQELVRTYKDNGMWVKKVFRKMDEYTCFGRKDFDSSAWHYQWMMYIVWSKLLQNPSFRSILLKIPSDAVIVEDESDRKNIADRWGCVNLTMKELRKVDKKKIIREYGKRICKTRLKQMIKESEMNIKNEGVFVGQNAMGKILMIARNCLIEGVAPAIDYDLLNGADIYWWGGKLQFPKVMVCKIKSREVKDNV